MILFNIPTRFLKATQTNPLSEATFGLQQFLGHILVALRP
jgi:hypothetical protein